MTGPWWLELPAEERWEIEAGRAWPTLTQEDLDSLRVGREWQAEYQGVPLDDDAPPEHPSDPT